MTSSWKRVTQRMSIALSSVLLVVLLAACGGSGTAASPTPTPKPTNTPTPTPTPAVAIYTGSGYSISYPKDWKESATSIGVTFQDAQGFNAFSIVVGPNPGGVVQPDTTAKATLASLVKEANMANPSPAAMPASTSVAGQSWVQKGTTGTVSKGGLSAPSEIVVLAANYPANSPNTKIYELIYAGPLLGTTLVDDQIFQSMLASFKFTA